MLCKLGCINFCLETKRIYHKFRLNHVLLIVCYTFFIFASATIFNHVEERHSGVYHERWKKKIENGRARFVANDLFPKIFNNSHLLLYVNKEKSKYLHQTFDMRIETYEKYLQLRPPMPPFAVNFRNSLLFVLSTVTTIGYGYIYPVTRAGRVVSMFIAFCGIPFTIVLLKDISYLLAVLLHFPCRLLEVIWTVFRFCTLRPVRESDLEKKLHEGRPEDGRDYRLENADRLLSIPVTVAVLAIVGWISIGCVLLHISYELPLSECLFVVFNSLATIGVDGVEIPEPDTRELIFIYTYLIIGLSTINLFINLLHTKFSRAYWMPGKLYLPLRQTQGFLSMRHTATFGSFEEMTMSDVPVNHMVTLGILQTDDKCPLIAVMSKEKALHEVFTQTGESNNTGIKASRSSDQTSPPQVRLPSRYTTSTENVNELIVETYGPRPARLIR